MNKRFVLKSNEDISRLVHAKRSVGNKYYVIYHSNNDETTPKIAVSISKHVGKAVVRNHEKRIVREILRKNHLVALAHTKVLIVIKASALALDYNEKEKNINLLIGKIKEKCK